MNDSPFLIYDAFFYVLALLALAITGSVVMLVFGIVFACLLGIDIRRLVPAEISKKEVHSDDDPPEQTPDA